MGGAAGTGVDAAGITAAGGEGGVTTWIMDLVQQQEYVVNLGAAIWPSGGWGNRGKFGGGGSFFYRGGELLMACGGGGAAGGYREDTSTGLDFLFNTTYACLLYTSPSPRD